MNSRSKRSRKHRPSAKRVKPEFIDVELDIPENLMRGIRREVHKLREHGVRVPATYIIKQRLATALALEKYNEVMQVVSVKPLEAL